MRVLRKDVLGCLGGRKCGVVVIFDCVDTYPRGPFHPSLIIHRPDVIEAWLLLGEFLTKGSGESLIKGLSEIPGLVYHHGTTERPHDTKDKQILDHILKVGEGD